MNKRGKLLEKVLSKKDKKAMELAIGTVVIIVLAILILISLLVFWNSQTGIFSDFLENLAGKTNVDAIVTSCNSFVTRSAVYDYCCVEREVKYEVDGSLIEEKITCKALADKPIGERINKLDCEAAC
jgi:uncharacterized protein YxeA